MSEKPACWGCECGVPVDSNGMHTENSDYSEAIYAYPCLAAEVFHGHVAWFHGFDELSEWPKSDGEP